jgi:hypothetical protein
MVAPQTACITRTISSLLEGIDTEAIITHRVPGVPKPSHFVRVGVVITCAGIADRCGHCEGDRVRWRRRGGDRQMVELASLVHRQRTGRRRGTGRLQCCNDEAPLRRGIERRRRGRAAGGYKLVDKSNHRVFAILARDAARSSRWCGPLLESVTEWQ